jgi:membrane-associated phospholipid phosphatase
MGEWLESLVPWGTEVLVKIQSYTPEWLVIVFVGFTFLGYEEFYLLVLPLIFWCIDRQIGVRLGFISLFSAWLNSVFKYLFAIPRPSDPRLNVPYPDTSPSFPSGHAQNAVVNWGYLAYSFRKPIFTIVAVVIILGISLSRMVLGVHFPQDVIGGGLIGLVLLVVFIWAEPPASRWLGAQSRVVQATLAVAGPLVLIFLHPADTEGYYPASGSITPMSVIAGFAVGLVMEQTWVRFRVEGEWWRRGLRLLLGLVVVAIFYAGPRFLLPEEMAYGLEAALRFVRYALVGWSVAFLCPWLFVRLRLAEGDGGR